MKARERLEQAVEEWRSDPTYAGAEKMRDAALALLQKGDRVRWWRDGDEGTGTYDYTASGPSAGNPHHILTGGGAVWAARVERIPEDAK